MLSGVVNSAASRDITKTPTQPMKNSDSDIKYEKTGYQENT
jgi:hypothetical protein